MNKKMVRRFSLLAVVAAFLIPTALPTSAKPLKEPTFENVSVHDPSIVKKGDTYYVFGSHIEAAKSTDLISWAKFSNGYTTPNNAIFGDLPKNLAESFAWAGQNDSDSKGGYSVWAPDVFWNKDYINKDGSKGAYMMYYCVSSTYIRSAIGFAVSQNIEGPYTYGATLIYSGFTRDEAYDKDSKVNKKWTNTNISKLIEQGTVSDSSSSWFNKDGSYANQMFPNAIDPNLFYDKDGKLHMSYGSWSGGIFVLDIDKATGKPIYPGKDGATDDGRMIDRYFGTKIAGGYGKSGEGPYIAYDKKSGYYYLYVTYGGLASDGGYNMRQFRSKNAEGPYVDAAGQDAVLTGNVDNAPIGNKLIGNYLFDRKPGDPGTGEGLGYLSPGHNSVYIDPDTGRQFLIFHSRFPKNGEGHEVRVHQMFVNKEGWPVVAPYRYAGETLTKVDNKDLVGDYKYINHGKEYSAKIQKSLSIHLNKNGSITGAVKGTWKKTGQNQATLKIDGKTYEGFFLRQWDPVSQSEVMTFTALSNEGISIWGSKLPNRSDKDIVKDTLKELDLGNTQSVISNLVLPTEGTHGALISWKSSNPSVISEKGVIHRPEPGSTNATAVLTATITRGKEKATKSFNVTVMPYTAATLTANYSFEDNLKEAQGKLSAGTVIGAKIDQTTGGSITFAEGKKGKAAVFNGASGIRLPDGLIASSSYSVSLWLKPAELTPFTPTFFGARDNNSWVSLVPSGPASNQTMVWSGSTSWYDAPTGMTIKAGEWTHLAFTVDQGTVTVYVNGQPKFTGENFKDVFTTKDGTFALGVNWWDPAFKGSMDELNIYTGALTPQQIQGLAEMK